MEKICVVGLGYIGLPSASVMASHGFRVHGVDVNVRIVDTIRGGESHIYEPDLDMLVKRVVENGSLTVSLAPEPADVFIIAVPTPFKDEYVPDLTYVEAATRSIAPVLKPGNGVVLESTSPIGTTEKIGQWLSEMRPDLNIPTASDTSASGEQIYLAHCPERVLPGRILRELLENDRIIGGIDEPSGRVIGDLYRTFVKGEVILTDARTAELCKLTENSFRDVNIAFANELSLICDKFGIEVWELIQLANRHPRVNILQPGPGVGGHCIAVDPWFIVDSAPEEARLIRTAREVNDHKPHYVVHRVRELARKLKDPIIACLGLSYKADIDDLRESPAVEITKLVSESVEGRVMAVEPHIHEMPAALASSNVDLVSLDEALEKADIIVLLVNHTMFRGVDASALKGKEIVDTRGLWRHLNAE